MNKEEFSSIKLNLNKIILNLKQIKFSNSFNLELHKLLIEDPGYSHSFKGTFASASIVLQTICSLAEQAFNQQERRRFGSIGTDDLWDLSLHLSIPQLAAVLYPERAESTTARNNVREQIIKLASVTDQNGDAVLLKAYLTRGHDCVIRLQKKALDFYFGSESYTLLPKEIFNLPFLGANDRISYQDRLVLYSLIDEYRIKMIQNSNQVIDPHTLLITIGGKIFAIAKSAYRKVKNALKHLIKVGLYDLTYGFNGALSYVVQKIIDLFQGKAPTPIVAQGFSKSRKRGTLDFPVAEKPRFG